MGLTPGSGTTLGAITSPGAGRAQDSPFSDELRHFLLHLLALQLFLQQQFKPSHRAIALGVLLVSLGRRERQEHLGDTSVWSWEEWRIGETPEKTVVQSLSHVQLFVTPWTAACQASHPSPSPGVGSNSCPLGQ